MGDAEIPYWQAYQVCLLSKYIDHLLVFLNEKHCEIWKYSPNCYFKKNAVRGVIASVCCAVFFILIGLVYKFRWKSLRDDDEDEQEMNGKYQNINISHFFKLIDCDEYCILI